LFLCGGDSAISHLFKDRAFPARSSFLVALLSPLLLPLRPPPLPRNTLSRLAALRSCLSLTSFLPLLLLLLLLWAAAAAAVAVVADTFVSFGSTSNGGGFPIIRTGHAQFFGVLIPQATAKPAAHIPSSLFDAALRYKSRFLVRMTKACGNLLLVMLDG